VEPWASFVAVTCWLTATDRLVFGTISAGHTVLLVVAGVVTAIPLLLFAGAANRIPLSSIGLVQYLGPVLQLGCGVLIFHEPMPPARIAGFTLVWAALAVFTWDALRNGRGPGLRRSPAPGQSSYRV